MIVRICHEDGCRTRLSTYNAGKLCWEHRRSTRRIEEELDGKHVQRDDAWLLALLDLDHAEIETWRPHVMSDTFIKGLERRELTPAERARYSGGEW